MQATIKANIGYQSYSDFLVDLSSDQLVTWSKNCLNSHGLTCGAEPTYAYGYFNETGSAPVNQTIDSSIAGFNYTSSIYDQQICLKSEDYDYFCSLQNFNFSAANYIYGDHWTKGSSAFSGVIGMGSMSPIWNISHQITDPFSHDPYKSDYNDYN